MMKMETNKISKTNWFWVSFASLCLLISIAFMEIFFFYPQAQRYFENSESLTAQPLTARSRSYLLKTLKLMTVYPLDASEIQELTTHIDISYSLLNINLYLSEYPCTEPSLQKLDSLSMHITSSIHPSIYEFTRLLLPVIQCVEEIETGQDAKRSALANTMLEDLTFQRRLLFWGILFASITGFGSWILHINQSRTIARNKNEKDKWLNNAMRDSLTGALNRRAFDQDLARCMDHFQSNTRSSVFSLIMCDIDYFKQYNDTLGHIQGDKALQVITKALTSILGDGDKLYRYGGEEIVIILNQTDHFYAKQIGTRMIDLVMGLGLKHPTSEHGFVTVSLGCATVNEKIKNGQSLIALADKRLYTAKQSGRNKLVT